MSGRAPAVFAAAVSVNIPGMASTTATTGQTAGYYLVNAGSQGYGVVYAKGPAAGTPHSVFLGTTAKEIETNLPTAVSHLGLQGLFEAPGGAAEITHLALTKHSAWYHGTPGNAVATNDLYTLALGSVGGPLARVASGILNYAGLTDAFGIDGETGAATTAPRNLNGGAADATDVNQATGADSGATDQTSGPKDSQSAKDSQAAKDENPSQIPKLAPPAVSAASGLLSFLTDPKTWLRFLEMIGGGLLILMGLKSLTGDTTTNPVDLIPSSARQAATAAAMG